MNNNIGNLINDISIKYNLNSVEIGELTTRFQNDTRDLSVVEKELNNAGSYYKYQHKLNDIISNNIDVSNILFMVISSILCTILVIIFLKMKN